MFIFKMSVDLFFYYYNYFKFILMEFEKKKFIGGILKTVAFHSDTNCTSSPLKRKRSMLTVF